MCPADVFAWDEVMDLTEAERDQLHKQMGPGQARILRKLISVMPPRTQGPEPTKPQFPEIDIGAALQKNAALRTIGRGPTPSQEAVNLFAKLQYAAAALEPPYIPYPAPNLGEEPWTPHILDVKRAIDSDGANRKKYGVKKNYMRVAHLSPAHLRAIAAGEVAGAWDKFGGLGLQ